MSAINNALSELADNQSTKQEQVVKANVKPVKQLKVLPWVVGSFGLSLAVGGWAISSQTPVIDPQPLPTVGVEKANEPISSPTSKSSVSSDTIYLSQPRLVSKLNPLPNEVEAAKASVEPEPATIKEASIAAPSVKVAQGQVVIQQVELSPAQLAKKAQSRAKKALDNNNLTEALKHYQEALRYAPDNVKYRKKLSALYYGKGEVRKAVDILRKGIQIDKEESALRMSLAKLLIKEQQNEAALTALVHVPQKAPVEYLSLRAALAQKSKQDDIALSSYQSLVTLEPDSGRWWLGLGIQQERALNLAKAEEAYQQALTKLGLSSQSQQFIRDRLSLISRLKEQPDAN
ncbi:MULTISPECIES: tetratricopeptide repeat protein [Vibrio]|uniref:tetratricopeptide repeat protein n=1 Tax=Vibrio TaxID=662 RepID=UPI002075C93C|nr:MULTISPECIES: tetratricopeptide repeat protein [Vibrio]USD32870.1 tetratricopeptide repeat protein [Vibrio sp. SCSIO 43186]USD45910.1 tetratricopeptide repeat protein [Vibrio sp. SCSIO 43145]USD69995.1 tetratricopeptide repeat protein [Vibrio sp. SCSIO 43139]USD94902.1 MSHA biogenesis protein MshN [Vibrio coralliilyticus]